MDSRMKGIWIGAMAMVAAALAACTAAPAPRGLEAGTQTGPRFELHLVPGSSYSARQGFGPFGYTVQPQVAAWLETADGRFVETLFVTSKGDRSAWLMAPSEGRPEALPVWFHLRKEGPDTVSAATSPGETRVGSSLASRLPAGRYVVKLEANRSYDWNGSYTKETSGVNGQPSLVYRAELEVGGPPAEAAFRQVGTGSVDGKDGTVRPGSEGITTAFELFSAMTVAYLP